MPDHDELDLLLRSALNTYADPGPESDLTRRILARISAEAAPAPPRRWLSWAIALPIAACLLALIVLSGPRPAHRPSGHAGQTPTSRQSLIATAHPGLSSTPHHIPSRNSRNLKPQSHRAVFAAKAAPLPKLDVFPTPRPLTPEEQALAVFAAHAPESERQSLIEAQANADAPLSIAAIQIQPLEPPDQGAN